MNKHCNGKFKYYLFLILFSFSSTISFAQTSKFNTTDWKFSNPQQFGFTVLDVDFFDNNTAIAVGSDGGIGRTTDGGSNWTYGVFTYINPAGFTAKANFIDVHFITSTIAYAVGSLGVMAKTTDAGITWSLVNTPLYANAKNINTCWFIDANKGYIGGAYNNTSDSLPKLYVTNNGGSTWDSIAAPAVNGVTRVGYINNVNIPSVLWPVDAKLKEIYRIEFTSTGVGYICGQGSPLFPSVSLRAVSTTVCTPGTSFLTTGAHTAALLWKFQNGVLTDYSISKERIGYSGINTNTVNCTTGFGNLSPAAQTYRAMNIINDSLVVMMSFNNNTVVRVRTGTNDFTGNLNNSNALEKGKYEVLNYPFPPTGGPQAGPPIPPVQVLLASNPYQIRKAANGKLFVAAGFGRMFSSVDTGRNWVQSIALPQGKNYSTYNILGFDIAPNGKFLTMGALGVVADSVPGTSWKSNYVTVPASAAFTKMEFADCNNGVATGSGNINVTTDGGKTWWDRTRQDFISSFYSINGFSYVNNNPAKAYFAVSNGTIYSTANLNIAPPATPTLDPVYANGLMVMNDIATVGNDSAWAIGYYANAVPANLRTSKIFRTINGGVSWIEYSGFSVGTLSQNLTDIEFPSRLIGYAAGNRDTIYKTTNGGVTWSKLPLPSPGVTPQLTYRDMFAVNDNLVFIVGNGFPRRQVLRTTDGGATWQDISGNLIAQGAGNFNGVLFQDANNGYVMTPGLMFKTTNGGTTWTMEAPPTGCIFEVAAFSPKKAPASVPFANRKLFVSGVNISGAPIMEYGNPANINVNSTETVTGGCNIGAQGSIVINATGGIAPYTYSINGGPFQTSNTFTGLTSGTKTITIKDAYCGTLTKTVIVDVKASPYVYAGTDLTIVDGDSVRLHGTATGTAASIAWTPNTTLTGANTFTPVATPNTTTNYTLTVTELNGCVSSDNVLVTVIPYCVKVMNAFTPNGDGINDRWLVTNGAACTKQIIAKVFNRYGELVYSNDNYNNDWDGKYKGKPVADGTYYYVLQYRLINGNSIPVKGDVTILR